MNLHKAKLNLTRLKAEEKTASGWERQELRQQIRELAGMIAEAEYRAKRADLGRNMMGAY